MTESHYVDIVVLTIAGALWATFVISLSVRLYRSLQRKKRYYHRARNKLRSKIINLDNQIKILSENEIHYVQTLQVAGFSKLKAIRQALAVAEGCVESLQANGLLSESIELADWLLSYESNMRTPATLDSECLDTLIGWEDHAREILICCTEAIAASSNQNNAIGVKRSQSLRRPTKVNLAELRRWLIR